MRRPSILIIIALVVACNSSSPLEPTPPVQPPPGQTNCGLGAIPSCPSVTPGCPRSRPPGAQTLVTISTCGFAWSALSCTPVSVPGCPFVEHGAVAYLLVNPESPTPLCAGEIHVRVEPADGARTRVLWDAQEKAHMPDAGCRAVGPEYEGETIVEGSCCQAIIDIQLPNAKRTFRMAVATDWRASPR